MNKKDKNKLVTIKLPYYGVSDSDKAFLYRLQEEYSSFFRICYNRFCDGYTEKEIREYYHKLNNITNVKPLQF